MLIKWHTKTGWIIDQLGMRLNEREASGRLAGPGSQFTAFPGFIVIINGQLWCQIPMYF